MSLMRSFFVMDDPKKLNGKKYKTFMNFDLK